MGRNSSFTLPSANLHAFSRRRQPKSASCAPWMSRNAVASFGLTYSSGLRLITVSASSIPSVSLRARRLPDALRTGELTWLELISAASCSVRLHALPSQSSPVESNPFQAQTHPFHSSTPFHPNSSQRPLVARLDAPHPIAFDHSSKFVTLPTWMRRAVRSLSSSRK